MGTVIHHEARSIPGGNGYLRIHDGGIHIPGRRDRDHLAGRDVTLTTTTTVRDARFGQSRVF